MPKQAMAMNRNACKPAGHRWRRREVAKRCRYGVVALKGCLVALIAAAVMLFTATAQAEVSEAHREALNQAQTYYDKQQYPQAVETLTGIVEQDPTVAPAHRLLGHVYYAMDKPGKARAAFVEALGRGRLTAAMLGRLVRLDQTAGRSHAALAGLWLRSLLAPDAPAWQRLHMRLLLQHGWAERAQAMGRSIVEKRPADVKALQLLGNSYLRTQDYRQAAEALSEAFELGVRKPTLAQAIGDAWRQLDRPRAALDWYDRALAAMNQSGRRDELVIRRASLLVAAGLTDRPTPRLHTLAEGQGDQAGKAALRLGQLAQASGNTEAALRHWQTALKKGIDKPALLLALGDYHFNQRDYKRAATLLRRRVNQGDSKAAVYRRWVQSLIRSDQPAAAQQALQRYLAQFGLSKNGRQLIAAWREQGG